MHNPRNESLLDELLNLYKFLVNKEYLNNLHNLTFCPSNKAGSIILLKIEMLTEPLSPNFFSFVLDTLGDLNGVFGYILQSSHHKLTFYVGVKAAKSMGTALDVLKSGLISSYPNSEVRELSLEESSLILAKVFNPDSYQALSSAIVIPNNTSSSNTPINQKLLELMNKEDFVAFFLASSCIGDEIKCFIKELEDLYTELSSFSQTEYELTHSFAKNPSTQISKSITETDGTSCTVTNGITNECSTTKGIIIAPLAVVQPKDLPQLSLGLSYSETSEIDNTNDRSVAEEECKQYAVTKSNLSGTSNTTTDSKEICFTSENKSITDRLAKLDTIIERLSSISNEVLFCFGAYFLSSSKATSIRAARTYAGLAKDKTLNIEGPFITMWEADDSIFPELIEELRYFNHLTFVMTPKNKCITNYTLITSLELLNSFYFPYPKWNTSSLYNTHIRNLTIK
ncbi:hypothetical protein [Cellulosilyticum sp. I15G10I2]|uniref:hypothetical protein n=1 Tax=Cellulosilyticum sp. I15G10I2 TaxID=1892843 RepID=UPI00085CD77F|nr:hypothetical protein [Cellulosilyticum sp. I15G10I2]